MISIVQTVHTSGQNWGTIAIIISGIAIPVIGFVSGIAIKATKYFTTRADTYRQQTETLIKEQVQVIVDGLRDEIQSLRTGQAAITAEQMRVKKHLKATEQKLERKQR